MKQKKECVTKNLRFSKTTFDYVQNKAKLENRSFNNMVETLLMRYLEKHEKLEKKD